jgi:hypothetical protein
VANTKLLLLRQPGGRLRITVYDRWEGSLDDRWGGSLDDRWGGSLDERCGGSLDNRWV